MGISLKTHKMLWSRSGNQCAFPDCKAELVADISETDDPSVVGEEAHIVAKEEGGPRGISTLSGEQRDKYENLILLCRNHHKVIDDQPEFYPIEWLKDRKKDHVDWVKQNLSIDVKKQREDEIYASYIDELINLIDIENYIGWMSGLQGCADPSMSEEQYLNLKKLTRFLISRVWFNRYPDLENALLNFKNVLNDLLNVFEKHSEKQKDSEMILTIKFYRLNFWDEELYRKLLNKYNFHIDLIDDLISELTRAINYVFDKVREYLFPSFRISEGVLLVEFGPFSDLKTRTYRLEYRGLERIDFPYPGLRKFMDIRSTRDVCWGSGDSVDYSPHTFEER
jgi:hypothetical protein